MKRKPIALLLAALMIVALTACQQPAAPATPAAPAAPAPTPAPAPAADNTVYDVQIATVYTAEHVFAVAMDKMAADLNSASKGRLKAATFHNSTLGSEKDEVDGIAAGSLTMAIAGGGQIGNLYAPVSVFDAPYCIRDNAHLQAVSDSDIGKSIWDDMAAKTKIRSLGSLYAGARFITTSQKAVNTPEDLKGLKIRVPDQPLSIAIFKALGANPTPMAFSEVYLALQQNVVDGQENPLTQIMSAKFYEVQKYISTTAHVTQVVFLLINEDFYNSLPDDLHKLLTDTAKASCLSASEESAKFEADTLNKLSTEYKMTVCNPDKEAFKALAAPVIKENAAKWGEGVYEKIQAIG